MRVCVCAWRGGTCLLAHDIPCGCAGFPVCNVKHFALNNCCPCCGVCRRRATEKLSHAKLSRIVRTAQGTLPLYGHPPPCCSPAVSSASGDQSRSHQVEHKASEKGQSRFRHQSRTIFLTFYLACSLLLTRSTLFLTLASVSCISHAPVSRMRAGWRGPGSTNNGSHQGKWSELASEMTTCLSVSTW
jgi:hypothetical protein